MLHFSFIKIILCMHNLPQYYNIVASKYKVIKAALLTYFLLVLLQKSKKATSPDEVPATKIGLSTFYGPVSSTLTCLINEQSLQLQEMLGNGAFGYVRKGVWNADQIKKVTLS